MPKHHASHLPKRLFNLPMTSLDIIEAMPFVRS